MLAQAIAEQIESEYVGGPADEAMQAEIIFAGFWTDKGTCSDELRAFLEKLHGKTVALFGTAGFGGSAQYFEKLLAGVGGLVPEDNTLTKGFMCQGKMPAAVRERYVKMGNAQGVENFDRALTHPDQCDLDGVRAWAQEIVDGKR